MHNIANTHIYVEIDQDGIKSPKYFKRLHKPPVELFPNKYSWTSSLTVHLLAVSTHNTQGAGRMTVKMIRIAITKNGRYSPLKQDWVPS